MPGMSAAQYIPVVARQYDLPVHLVAALVQVESGGDRWAMRTEPAYRYLWDVRRGRPFRCSSGVAAARTPPAGFGAPDGISRITEWIGQQTSWGYMQVMGAVAREYGYTGHFPGLCDPLEGLHYGCRHLVRLRDRFHAEHGWVGVAAAFNAGSPRRTNSGAWENQAYVDKLAAGGGFPDLK